jgi:leader peptidase (prepilin peptidase) / N-methyltransferase
LPEVSAAAGVGYLVAAAVLGLLFGSFLNVCIYRLPRDLSVVTPRSFCPECGARIGWRDNIPLLSYALLRGRCRHCGKRIGVRYPFVEGTLAVLLVAAIYRYGWTVAGFKWSVFEAIMVTLFWTDIEERLLPDEFTLGGTLAGVLFAFFVMVPGAAGELLLPQRGPLARSLVNAGLAALFIAGPIWFIGFAYSHLRKKEGLGMGDVKLLLLLGVFLGLENGLLALLIGAVSGSVLGLIYVRVTHKDAGSYELPFGSFLCAGGALVPLLVKI